MSWHYLQGASREEMIMKSTKSNPRPRTDWVEVLRPLGLVRERVNDSFLRVRGSNTMSSKTG